jgi:hypothetical protein
VANEGKPEPGLRCVFCKGPVGLHDPGLGLWECLGRCHEKMPTLPSGPRIHHIVYAEPIPLEEDKHE